VPISPAPMNRTVAYDPDRLRSPNSLSGKNFDTAMILIEVSGVRLLTAPVLDPAGSAFVYGAYQLEKTSPASVTPDQLGRIDAVLLSDEQDGDNLDRAGRELLRSVPRVLTRHARDNWPSHGLRHHYGRRDKDICIR
jgi:hypothetical protein